MNLTHDYLKSSRKWVVPNFSVWGSAAAYEIGLLFCEEAAAKRVVFCNALLGGQDQTVDFSDLVDARGNHLPATILNPVVIIIPRGPDVCYLAGRPSANGFKIACATPGARPIVDLCIMEIDLP